MSSPHHSHRPGRRARRPRKTLAKRSPFGTELGALSRGASPEPIAKRLLGPNIYPRWVRAVMYADPRTGKISRERLRGLDSFRGRKTLQLLLILWELGRETQRRGVQRAFGAWGKGVWRGTQARRMRCCTKTCDRVSQALRAADLVEYHQPSDDAPESMRSSSEHPYNAYNLYHFDISREAQLRFRAWRGSAGKPRLQQEAVQTPPGAPIERPTQGPGAMGRETKPPPLPGPDGFSQPALQYLKSVGIDPYDLPG